MERGNGARVGEYRVRGTGVLEYVTAVTCGVSIYQKVYYKQKFN